MPQAEPATQEWSFSELTQRGHRFPLGWVNRGLAAFAKQSDVNPFFNFPVRVGLHLEALPKRKKDECDQAEQNDTTQPMRCCRRPIILHLDVFAPCLPGRTKPKGRHIYLGFRDGYNFVPLHRTMRPIASPDRKGA